MKRLVLRPGKVSLAEWERVYRGASIALPPECLKAASRCATRAGTRTGIPGQGSVGASGDLAPLAHMSAAMLGVGEMFVGNERVPATEALRRAGLARFALGPKEGLALLNGTQFSTACALGGLFEVERVFGAAIVVGALSTGAARGSDGPFDPRIHTLRRHHGQIEVAAALRRLMAGSTIRASHLKNDPRVQDPYCALPTPGHGSRARPAAPGGALAAGTALVRSAEIMDAAGPELMPRVWDETAHLAQKTIELQAEH